jgi:hypothetical protein
MHPSASTLFVKNRLWRVPAAERFGGMSPANPPASPRRDDFGKCFGSGFVEIASVRFVFRRSHMLLDHDKRRVAGEFFLDLVCRLIG